MNKKLNRCASLLNNIMNDNGLFYFYFANL